MLNPLGVLSLQLACELLVSKNSSFFGIIPRAPLIKSAAELPEGYTPFPDIGVAYKYHAEPKLSWNAARKYCEAQGGNLAVIDSLKKIGYLKSIGLTANYVWVGLHRFFDEAEWMSVKHGSLETPLPWRPTDTYIETITYRCARVRLDSNTGLYAYDCTDISYFICEVSIFKDRKFAATEWL